MTNEEMLGVAEIVERLVTRFHEQAADHETKMAEHRASFGARTDADAKLIAGLREERNGLLTQVQDTLDASLRELEQIDRLVNPDREESTVIVVKRMLDQHRLIAREYDKAVSLCETEEQTPEQCIVSLNARIDRLHAERAAKTEPVEIKVGDLVEVVSNRGSNTWFADVGSFGTVTSVEEINDSILVNLDNVPGKKNSLVGCVSFCDVRKVTT